MMGAPCCRNCAFYIDLDQGDEPDSAFCVSEGDYVSGAGYCDFYYPVPAL